VIDLSVMVNAGKLDTVHSAGL